MLQVHHKVYIVGRKPWEYPHHLCESLCKACHAEEHGKIPPRFGWDLVGWDDLEDLIGFCELCGTSIRYTFLVQHQKWAPLEVGEFCCDNITSTQAASGHMDSLRRFNDRRKRFVSSRRWLRNAPGILTIKQRGIEVAIVESGSNLRLQMNGKKGRLEFRSILDAKMKAFDLIEAGIVSEYLRKASNSKVAC
ncbi:MAG TPA: hypothetical protein VFX06_01725 [Stellaceae bacterium]|nr:hypothetical protein [Stellaceae bacterium]